GAAPRARSLTYALMSTLDAAIGFESAAPRIKIPYSVSIPRTFLSATWATLPAARPVGYGGIRSVARLRALAALAVSAECRLVPGGTDAGYPTTGIGRWRPARWHVRRWSTRRLPS